MSSQAHLRAPVTVGRLFHPPPTALALVLLLLMRACGPCFPTFYCSQGQFCSLSRPGRALPVCHPSDPDAVLVRAAGIALCR